MQWAAFWTTATLSIIASLAQEGPRIEIFSPQGEVRQVRQVRVRFSAPIVALGNPSLPEPFRIECPIKGSGRWSDSRNWLFDLENDAEAGVACRFFLKDETRALDGRPLGGQRTFEFNTGGPAILGSVPFEGHTSLTEDQAFVLQLSGPVDPASVLSYAWFHVEGIGERIGLKLIDGPDREAILASQYLFRDSEQTDYLLVVQAHRPFPNAAKIRLVWGQGVSTPSGLATSQDQALAFKTRDDFRIDFNCVRENVRSGCVPVTSMSLQFNALVSWETAQKVRLQAANGTVHQPRRENWERGSTEIGQVHFDGPFPPRTEFEIHLPAEFRDFSGRPLTNPSRFPLRVRTADHPPLAKFAGDFGVIELKGGALLPVTLRALEGEIPAELYRSVETLPGRRLRIGAAEADRIVDWLQRLSGNEWEDRKTSIFAASEAVRSFTLPTAKGGKAFEVVGIPLPDPGFYVVELKSEVLGQSLLDPPGPMFVRTGALVTDLAVHFKRGRESSLVWVTRLHDAKPVRGALVSLWDCEGRPRGQAQTDSQGLARLGGIAPSSIPQCGGRYGSGLLATAVKGGDLSFTHSSWDQGIEPWRFNLPTLYQDGDPLTARTVFARNLLRAGEAVHMKHILRNATMQGFEAVSVDSRPAGLLIRHQGSGQEYRQPIEWLNNGVALSDWTVPRQARLGLYQTYLIERLGEETGKQFSSGQFRVEEFRVPLASAEISSPSAPLISPQKVSLDLQVRYLAGGAAADLPVVFRHQFQIRAIAPPEGFEGYAFANGKLSDDPGTSFAIQRRALDLDKLGGARVAVEDIPQMDQPLQILAELEFRDPIGETQTVSRSIPLWPSDRLVGLRSKSWVVEKDSLEFEAAVTDVAGRPVANAAVKVDLFQRTTYSTRKRLVGGFYAFEHHVETRELGNACRGITDARGRLFCRSASPVSGQIILQAELEDVKASPAHVFLWAAGEDDWWFEAEDHDRIDVIPERPRYEVGETARFQVRMPFRQATALVTIEREGIIDAFVQPLSARRALVEVPLKDGYSPNVFVSVLAVRGRVGEIKPTATIDLGRPTYRLGIGEIKVGWGPHRLDVKLHSDQEVYQPRQVAKVEVQVKLPDGRPAVNGEIAVAAVDEGLLELSPNSSWDLLDSMMGRRSYEVATSTAQGQVVGKRHFGLKALPQGGGGGGGGARELFDTLLLWNGRVKLDGKGRAQVLIPLNDSLTRFRIAAVANDENDRFGSGTTTIRSTQQLMILPGLPPQVRQEDRFGAEFTVRNTSERSSRVEVEGRLIERTGGEERAIDLPQRRLELGPGQAETVIWDLTAPSDAGSLRYEISARSEDASDQLSVVQNIIPRVPVRTIQASLMRLDRPLRHLVARPAESEPSRGGIEVSLSASLTGGLDTVRRHMGDYPYSCLEQKLSRSVALRDQEGFGQLMEQLPVYLDADGFVKYFPDSHRGFPILTSYLLALSHEAGWDIPDQARFRMLNALRGFVEGRLNRVGTLNLADLSIRKLAAIEALSRYQSADPSLLQSFTIEPNLWPTSALLDWINILKRVDETPQKDRLAKEADQMLRARIHYEGTSLAFSDESRDNLWWLMAGADQNALRSILTLLESPDWQTDLPRLAVGAMQRRRQGHWDTTLANAWGVLAMEKFAERFESQVPSGVSQATLMGVGRPFHWDQGTDKGSLDFVWPDSDAGSELLVEHDGGGAPWAEVRSLAAVPRREPFAAGYRIVKAWAPVEPSRNEDWRRGDLVRVRLEIEAQADRTWVVVDDPIPPGAVVLGGGLGRDSSLATQDERDRGRAWKAFEERSFSNYRIYYEYVPKGLWAVEYTLRLNQAGRFQLPATRVEAMYSPEMFGESPNPVVLVGR